MQITVLFLTGIIIGLVRTLFVQVRKLNYRIRELESELEHERYEKEILENGYSERIQSRR